MGTMKLLPRIRDRQLLPRIRQRRMLIRFKPDYVEIKIPLTPITLGYLTRSKEKNNKEN